MSAIDQERPTRLTEATADDAVLSPTNLPEIPGYETLSVLGRGGMGVVYKARQLGLNRLVALKTILAGAHAGPKELARFRAEAEAVAQLQHPNIVQIYQIGEWQGQPYFSLEYVDGGSLADQLRGNALPPRQAAHLAETLSRAIHCAHQRGIIHRDLKPANILLQTGISSIANEVPSGGRDAVAGDSPRFDRFPLTRLNTPGLPKITDFGLAKRLTSDGHNVTRTGTAMGTPNYMAPEQALGNSKDIGPPTDIYALGVILYEMLTGRVPFPAETPLQLLAQAVRDDPPAPQKFQPNLPGDLVTICLKCLRKEPQQRYASAEDLAEDLRRFLNGMPILARPQGLVKRLISAARHQPFLVFLAVLLVSATIVLTTTNIITEHVLVPTAAVTLTGLLWQWRRAERQRKTAVEQRLQADEARREAEEHRLLAENSRREAVAQAQKAAQALRDAEAHLYSNRVALAEREWFANNVVRVEEILASCPVQLRSWEWHYLKRLLHTELRTFTGHNDWVRGIAFHPHGSQIVSAGGMDQVAKIWDPTTGKEFRTLVGHSHCVRAVAFSADGKRVATAGDDQTIRIYAADSGVCMAVCEGHQESVLNIAFSPDGQRMISASTDCTLRAWQVSTGQEVGRLARPESARGVPLFDAVYSPDGKRIAAAGKDRCVYVYDAATGDELHALKGHTDAVTSVAFSPDGSRLASAGSYDATAKIWDVATGQELRSLRGHAEAVWQVAFHPDSLHVATAGGDGAVRIWDAVSGKALFVLRGHTKSVTGVCFSPDGQLLATACTDGTVKIWPALTPQEATIFGNHSGVECLAWRPDGGELATGGAKGDLKIWDVIKRFTAADLSAHEGCTISVAFGPDGKRLASGGSDGVVKIWDAINQCGTAGHPEHKRPVSAVTFSPDYRHAASASMDGTAAIWDLATSKIKLTFRGHIGQLTAIAFHPHDQLVASASIDPLRTHLEVKLWNPNTGDELRTLLIPRHEEETALLCFSPNGVRLATASHGHTVKIWETFSGRELCTFHGHSKPVISMTFSPDGLRLVTASQDQTLKIWDIVTGHEVLTLRRFTEDIMQVTFHPNGRQLATIHRDGNIRFW